ncbi:MAG TPA: hypothetical protein VFM46_19490 [Pseudomonadales bacterium]|nr:hypothetical protein [Pseudomonadales bacterium]
MEMQLENDRLERDQLLVLPHPKRLVLRRTQNESGAPELHLDYGEKEISFDDPALFDFAEGLVRHPRFRAGDSAQWGEGYHWDDLKELLETLVAEGILMPVTGEQEQSAQERYCPSPLPPAQTTVPHTWLECEALTKQLTGRALELGYLEAVIPIYRVAHPVLDSEGRQVGEGNVFPKALRLDIPTDWRVCQHAGSRFQDELPMNVTALKTMRKHWVSCMQALLSVRAAYLKRFPHVLAGGWTVGDLQRLSTLVLALPAWLTMRAETPVKNGELHPVLSNLFRITDGARMALHYQLFMPVHEPVMTPDAPMDADTLFHYAERNNLFLSDHGVCAGPSSMIQEFLRVLVDGDYPPPTETLDPEINAALAQLESALDYGLLSLRVHAVVNALWPQMIRAYEQLDAVLSVWPGPGTTSLQRLRSSIRQKVNFFRTESVFNDEAIRIHREQVLADMFRQSGRGLGLTGSDTDLFQFIAPVAQSNFAAEQHLHSILYQRLSRSSNEDALVASLTELLMRYFLREQGIVRAVCAIQMKINRLLGRAEPRKPFLASDINLYFRMQDGARRLPYLVAEELEEMIGVRAEVSAHAIRFSRADNSEK